MSRTRDGVREIRVSLGSAPSMHQVCLFLLVLLPGAIAWHTIWLRSAEKIMFFLQQPPPKTHRWLLLR